MGNGALDVNPANQSKLTHERIMQDQAAGKDGNAKNVFL